MRIKSTPIVNDMHFTDAHAVGAPAPPPKYVGVPGKRPIAKGLTNRRVISNI